jgi:hypothetical protein
MKKCTKCGAEKELDDFTKGKRYADGRHPWCKICQSEYQKRRWASLSQFERDAASARVAKRAKKLERRGFCARCHARKRITGKSHCQQCLDEKIAHQKRVRLGWLEQGLCGRCGKQSVVPNTTLCTECTEGNSKRGREAIIRRIEKRLCTRCGADTSGGTNRFCTFCRSKVKQSLRDIKAETFEAYGGAKCYCCGETIFVLLGIDHMNNDGAQHRKEMTGSTRSGGGRVLYLWLKRNNWPSGFQVACFSCNMGRHLNGGICPHQAAKE